MARHVEEGVDMAAFTRSQIEDYVEAARGEGIEWSN